MNKYLEKVASASSTWQGIKNTRYTIGGAVLGGTAGGYAGSRPGKTKDHLFAKPREKTKHDKIMGGIGGALAGAYLGAAVGIHKDMGRVYGKNWKQAHRSTGASHGAGSGRTIHHVHQDLGAPKGFKTKTEAKTHFRRQASIHHPDKHQGAAKEKANAQMAKLNAAWKEYQAHPQGFEKLANEYLEKIAGMFGTLRKGKDLIRNKPLTQPIKGANLMTKKPALKKPTGL